MILERGHMNARVSATAATIGSLMASIGAAANVAALGWDISSISSYGSPGIAWMCASLGWLLCAAIHASMLRVPK